MKHGKNPMIAEAEQVLDEARLRLRTAAAFHSFVVCGNTEMAARMRALVMERPNAPVIELVERFPAFRRYGDLLLLAHQAEAVA